jgi:hypothetical protein
LKKENHIDNESVGDIRIEKAVQNIGGENAEDRDALTNSRVHGKEDAQADKDLVVDETKSVLPDEEELPTGKEEAPAASSSCTAAQNRDIAYDTQPAEDQFPPIPFLHDHAYIRVINARNASVIKGWLKSCNVKTLPTARENRALLIQYIKNIADSNHPKKNITTDDRYALAPIVIEEITGCITDQLIQKELTMRGASTVGSAEQKKNRLIGLLIEQYGASKNGGKKKQKKTKKGKSKSGTAKNDKNGPTSQEQIPSGSLHGLGLNIPHKNAGDLADIDETISNVVEQPLKTLEENLLKMGARIERQEILAT